MKPQALPAGSPVGVRATAQRRTRVALQLTALLLAIYFGFMFLVAFGKPLLAVQVGDGVSLALLLAAFTILSAVALAALYVGWANRHHDGNVDRLG
jgi:uncharacterized membrane protein (DUF485 family)